MNSARRQIYLILCGVAALVLAILVLVRNQSPDDDMLAAGLLIGGLAIVIVSLPAARNGRNGDGNGT